MKTRKYNLAIVAMALLPNISLAEVWTCDNPWAKSKLYTNAPTSSQQQNCRQHKPQNGSYSTVSSSYFELRVDEIQQLYDEAPTPSSVPKHHEAFNVRLLADQEEQSVKKRSK